MYFVHKGFLIQNEVCHSSVSLCYNEAIYQTFDRVIFKRVVRECLWKAHASLQQSSTDVENLKQGVLKQFRRRMMELLRKTLLFFIWAKEKVSSRGFKAT